MTTTDPEPNQGSHDEDAPDDQQKIEDVETLIEVVSNLANPRGPLLDGSRDPALIRSRIQNAAEAAGLNVSIEADSEDATLTTRGHPDDSHWAKHGHGVTGTVKVGPISWQFDERGDEVEDLSSRFQVHASNDHEVNLECSITGLLRGYEMNLGGVVTLAPDQADGLAAALMAAAEQARDGGARSRLPSMAEHRAESVLEAYDIERGDLGTTRIEISESVEAIVFDEGDPDTVEIDTRDLDQGMPEVESHVSLSIDDAKELRGALDEALSARRVERDRYDDVVEDDG